MWQAKSGVQRDRSLQGSLRLRKFWLSLHGTGAEQSFSEEVQQACVIWHLPEPLPDNLNCFLGIAKLQIRNSKPDVPEIILGGEQSRLTKIVFRQFEMILHRVENSVHESKLFRFWVDLKTYSNHLHPIVERTMIDAQGSEVEVRVLILSVECDSPSIGIHGSLSLSVRFQSLGPNVLKFRRIMAVFDELLARRNRGSKVPCVDTCQSQIKADIVGGLIMLKGSLKKRYCAIIQVEFGERYAECQLRFRIQIRRTHVRGHYPVQQV